MTTAITHANRSWLPPLTLLLAGGAAALSVVAITSDDVGSTTLVQAPRPADVPAHVDAPVNVPVYECLPAGWPATDAMRKHANRSAKRVENAEASANVPVHEHMPAGWPATDVMRRHATANGSAERAENVDAPSGMSDAPSRQTRRVSGDCYATATPLNIC